MIGPIWLVHALVTLAVLLYCNKRLHAIRKKSLDAMDHRVTGLHDQAKETANAPPANMEGDKKRAAIIASARQSRGLVLTSVLFLMILTVVLTLKTVVVLDWATPVVIGPSGDQAPSTRSGPASSSLLSTNTDSARRVRPITLGAPTLASKHVGPSDSPASHRIPSAPALDPTRASSAEHAVKAKPANPGERALALNRPAIDANWWHDICVSAYVLQIDNGASEAMPDLPAEVTLIYEAVYRRVIGYAAIGLSLIGAGGVVFWLLFWQLAVTEGRDPLSPREPRETACRVE
jgi:hypothetical protein